MAKSPGPAGDLKEALPATGSAGGTGGRGAASRGQRESREGSETTSRRPSRPEVALPTERRSGESRLEELMTTIYGPPKIGKSTLANEFHESVLFMDVEGTLGDLEVFSIPIPDWVTFLSACAVATKPETMKKHPIVCIDTVDMLSLHCSDYTNAALGVAHESDAGYGKGYHAKRTEFLRPLAKLAATPGLGVILVSHAKEQEIRARNMTYYKSVPDLDKAGRDAAVNMSDLILFCDYEGEGEEERRVLRTKPSRYWEAGERSKAPRLPETIEMSYEALKTAWYK